MTMLDRKNRGFIIFSPPVFADAIRGTAAKQSSTHEGEIFSTMVCLRNKTRSWPWRQELDESALVARLCGAQRSWRGSVGRAPGGGRNLAHLPAAAVSPPGRRGGRRGAGSYSRPRFA